MALSAASDVTVTANPTEADSDIAPQTSSSRARTPDVTVTAIPMEVDSGIGGEALRASSGPMMAGPRVSGNEEQIARGDNTNDNKEATDNDDYNKTTQREPHRVSCYAWPSTWSTSLSTVCTEVLME